MLIFLSFNNESDKEKFDYLYNKYKRLLLHKAYGILGDYSLAEDAVSEAYMRIYKNLDKIEDETSNKAVAFIVTIVKNTALTIRAKQFKEPPANEDERTPDSFDLENHIIDIDSTKGIYNLVNSLNDDLKSVFILKYAQDLSHKQIGEIMGITENNVTVKLHRAKKKLADLINKKEASI